MKKGLLFKLIVILVIEAIIIPLISFNHQSIAAATYTYKFNDVTYDYSEIPEILNQINIKRQENGLSNIVIDKNLLDIAKTRLQDNLVYRNTKDPIRPNGENISDYYKSNGIENPREKYYGLGKNEREEEYKYYYVKEMVNLYTGNNADVTRLGICAAWVQGTYMVQFVFLDGIADELTIMPENKTESITIPNIIKKAVYLDYYDTKYLNTIQEYTGNTHQIKLHTRIKTESGLSIGYELDKSCYNQFSWISYDDSVASVSDTGLVTFLDKTGTVTIITNYPNRSYDEEYTKATFNVIQNYSLQNIELSKTSLDLIKDEYEFLTVTYNPTNTTDDKTITWTSSNPDVATVSTGGFVRAISQGTAIITAETSNGIKDTCTVNVTEIPIQKIIIPKTVYVKLGDISQFSTTEYNTNPENKLNIKLYPENTTQKNVSFQINQMSQEEAELYDKVDMPYYVWIMGSRYYQNAYSMYGYNLGKTTIRAYSEDNPEIYTDFTVEVVEEIPQFLKGDVNGDGKVNAGDYVAILNYVRKKITLTEEQLQRADANGDGKINAGDYVTVLNIVRGKI